MPGISNEIGNDGENKAAKILQGSRVVQSGGGKYLKLDVTDKGGFVFSVKASRTIRDTALKAILKLWREACRGATGIQGHGDGKKPGMIFDLDGEMLVLIRLDDMADLATGEIASYIEPSKADVRRATSRQSRLG